MHLSILGHTLVIASIIKDFNNTHAPIFGHTPVDLLVTIIKGFNDTHVPIFGHTPVLVTIITVIASLLKVFNGTHFNGAKV